MQNKISMRPSTHGTAFLYLTDALVVMASSSLGSASSPLLPPHCFHSTRLLYPSSPPSSLPYVQPCTITSTLTCATPAPTPEPSPLLSPALSPAPTPVPAPPLLSFIIHCCHPLSSSVVSCCVAPLLCLCHCALAPFGNACTQHWHCCLCPPLGCCWLPSRPPQHWRCCGVRDIIVLLLSCQHLCLSSAPLLTPPLLPVASSSNIIVS
jgi:hypothetical protein